MEIQYDVDREIAEALDRIKKKVEAKIRLCEIMSIYERTGIMICYDG